MKYLAFDIEAANGYSLSSICCIGIVVADESFNILSKKNYWINPKCKYNLNGTRANIGINLNLDKELIDSSPTFAQCYNEISSLLTADDTFVLGHAVDSDILMLNAACRKYKLPCINFKYFCTQLLFKMYKAEKDVRALIKIANEIGVEFTEHLAEDDALVSLLTLKYLLNVNECDVGQLLNKYAIRIGVNKDFEVIRCVSLNGQVSKSSITKQMQEMITKSKEEFERNNKLKVSEKFNGYIFSMCSKIAFSCIDDTIEYIKRIYSLGGKYTNRLGKCTHYIHIDSNNNGDNMKYKHILQLIEKGSSVQIIDLQTFTDMLEG